MPNEFCEWISKVEVSIKNWNKYKQIHRNMREADTFELAKATFFLNRTNISGVIKGGVIGGQEQKGKYKIDVRFNKQDLINRIQKIISIKNRISVSNLDGLDFINKINNIKKEVFIYLDPPYFQKGADLYMNFYAKEDHKNLSRYVHNMKKKWMVSYDNHNFILNLYPQQNKIVYRLSQAASNRIGDEILIFSKGIEFINSIKALKSPLILECYR
jgi:DNA adenine methylase